MYSTQLFFFRFSEFIGLTSITFQALKKVVKMLILGGVKT